MSPPAVTVMMEKAVLLVLFCLFVTLSGSPLYPSIRFGQRDTSILMTSSLESPAQLKDDSTQTERAEIREEVEGYMKRQSNIYKGTYKEDLTSIQSNHRFTGLQDDGLLRPRLASTSAVSAIFNTK
ncbi:somatoliberin isoform X5 [Boleophthalmus pectinirostris]|uniref:somatoliberin isoform X5 n=1 Tax=Boleophthalmus pectinirostris TaxID=150288 RepID=UPI00242E6E60|nr:somatoliberin isoform X5 [Boleophthalmus pectinirostris]